MKLGYDQPTRISEIIKLEKQTPKRTIPIETPDGLSEEKVYSVSIELPKYRIENTRTKIHQLQHCLTNNVSDSTFNDPESMTAQ